MCIFCAISGLQALASVVCGNNIDQMKTLCIMVGAINAKKNFVADTTIGLIAI